MLKKTQATLTNWLELHLLFALSLFLIIFIPLYPKLPLLEAIPGYLVRVRLEDILVFLTGLVWLVQVLRKKITWRTNYHIFIIAYALAGLLSLAVAIFLQQTIPAQTLHISKSLLHYFRYLEYFSLFLFMFAGIKTKLHLKLVLISVVASLNLIFIYGMGQRYLSWPAFSTMNREYSKGQHLVLNPADKLQSTFGGHYDLAAWLVIVIPILLSWLLFSKSFKTKLLLGISITFGFWLMWQSGSKTSLLAVLTGCLIPSWYFLQSRWGKLKTNLAMLGGVGAMTILAFSILWLFKKPNLYKLAPFLRPAGFEAPIDATAAIGNETWSENAQKYGLSMGIRLDTLWPQAIEGFSLNPWTGKGYAALNKKGVNEFSDSDSTDNNYLRTLGETGLLGFAILFGLILVIYKTFLDHQPQDKLLKSLLIGLLGATTGLLINALVIDVFTASKVAFSYWALVGLATKSLYINNKQKMLKLDHQRWRLFVKTLQKTWPLLIAGVWLILLTHKRPFTEYSQIKSFAQAPAQAQYVAKTICLVQPGTCDTNYHLGLGSVYSWYLSPFYFLTQEPAIYYFANLILAFGSLFLLFKLLSKFTQDKLVHFLLLISIISLPTVYLLPNKSSPLNLYLFLFLLIGWMVMKKTNYKYLKTAIKPVQLKWGLGIVSVLVVLYSNYNQPIKLNILNNFRDLYRPSNFMAIRRANRYLATEDLKDKPLPILLSNIEPVLFDIYQQEDFQTQPLTSSKPDELFNKLQNPKSAELFITNANVDQSSLTQGLFEKYKNMFGIRLEAIDCRHHCNYYQLLTNPVLIPETPKTWNKDPVIIEEDNFNFAVVNSQVIDVIGAPKVLTKKNLDLRTKLSNLDSNMIFLSGDINSFTNIGWRFLDRVDPFSNSSLIAVTNGFEEPKHPNFNPPYQVFNLQETWFITIDAKSFHQGPQANLFLFDTLLQLEKHPQVKQVVVISHDSSWLASHPSNYYFEEDLSLRLASFEDTDFTFAFGKPLAQEEQARLSTAFSANTEFVSPQPDPVPYNSYLIGKYSQGKLIFSSHSLVN